jgi:hypothetical protein
MALNYDLSTVADQLAGILQQAEADLRLDQAVYGLDAKEELELHTIFFNGLRQHYEVAREVHYPSSVGAKLSHRLRCDLVLSPAGRPLRLDRNPPTLFDPPNPCDAKDALWLEIKMAYQYRTGGIRHSGYGSQWRLAVVEDLKKMETEPFIHEAALLLVVFNESVEILEKDLDLFETLLAQKEVLAGFRQVRTIPILDRIGHRLCTVALWPTIQR